LSQRKQTTILDINDVSELTPKMLKSCLQKAGERLRFHNVLLNSESRKEIVGDFFANFDHGLSHSQAVWNRCQEIISQSSLLWKVAVEQANRVGRDGNQARQALLLASIFHDLGRFLGFSFSTHEIIGAKLAAAINPDDTGFANVLYNLIIHHDYVCPIINGYDFPFEAVSPLAEIFRLADKTSNSPSEEIRRYYEVGRRLAPDKPLFKPDIPAEVRFDFTNSSPAGKDMLTWFLLLFALQSTDFLYGDTRDAYAYWARGKKEALEVIGDLCRQEEYLDGRTPTEPEEAMAVVIRFCQKHNLIISA